MTSIDDELRRMLEKIDFSKHPSAGKPLKLPDDPNTPDDMKLAHKIMMDNNVIPDWIMESNELDSAREKLRTRILSAHAKGGVPHQLYDEVVGFNKRVLTFNLKAPQGVRHKLFLDVDKEIDRLR